MRNAPCPARQPSTSRRRLSPAPRRHQPQRAHASGVQSRPRAPRRAERCPATSSNIPKSSCPPTSSTQCRSLRSLTRGLRVVRDQRSQDSKPTIIALPTPVGAQTRRSRRHKRQWGNCALVAVRRCHGLSATPVYSCMSPMTTVSPPAEGGWITVMSTCM